MNDEQLQALAGEYVLGTLSADQRAEVERRLASEAPLRAAVDAWEARLLPLADQVAPVQPSASLWPRIENSLPGPQPRPRQTGYGWHSLGLWRGLAGLGLAASLVLGTLLLLQQPVLAPPAYLVVLVAPQDKAPGWVIQASDQRQIRLIPLADTRVPDDKALEFWTKADDWQGPVSLGLVKPGQTLTVPLDRLPPLQPDQLFELTLENAKGSPIGKPTGPIQFIGRAVKVI